MRQKNLCKLESFYFQAGMEYLFSVQRANCLEDFLITIQALGGTTFSILIRLGFVYKRDFQFY